MWSVSFPVFKIIITSVKKKYGLFIVVLVLFEYVGIFFVRWSKKLWLKILFTDLLYEKNTVD